MGTSVSLSALGTAFELTLPDDTPLTYLESIHHAWSRCIIDDAQPRQIAPLQAPSPTDDSDESVRSAMQRLSQLVTRHIISAQTGNLLMFHAGAVSNPQTGKTLVYVAPSGTGKTTFSKLMGTTHGYLTDETAGIDPDSGRVFPYPKPLSVSQDGSRQKVESSPDDLNLLPAHPSPTLGRIILLHRDASWTRDPKMDELGTLDAILNLLPESSGTVKLNTPLQRLAALINGTGPVLRFTYREASDIAAQASALIGGQK